MFDQPTPDPNRLSVEYVTNLPAQRRQGEWLLDKIHASIHEAMLNDDVVEVEPGMVVYIEPFTAHKLTSAEGVKTVVFGVPALQPDDEYFVD